MSRVLVSGGTGQVGRFIVEDLIGQGYEVTTGGRTRPGAGAFSRPVRYVPLSLDPDIDQSRAFEGVDHFVHAAFDHVPGRYRGGEGGDPDGFRARNRDGTIRLFETARREGVRRCIFLSSRAVYGVQPPGSVLTEETTPHPDTLYGKVKLLAEQALAAMTRPDFVAVSLRVTGVYGAALPGQPQKWDGLFADYLAGRPIEPRAGSEVHGRDVARAVRLMLELPPEAVNGRVFNVSDLLVDRHDLLAGLQGATDCPHPLPAKASDTSQWLMITDRLQALGWKPGGKVLLEKTIRSLCASHIRDQDFPRSPQGKSSAHQ
ncbi:nucleoside-diphosphate-sugar epimerase [Hoeflea marina]|uniref:Nucleoside-diphosphate-sugar epimerase n=1 Tax=Hoeflea marina TaxID=274592 RepID=A0A317PDP8_9HYPH|nr:NAD(P)-dependent oxidoreductase [Hoeflea marina]PWV95496.1 nucleoside-diphosphate-sugar epimerase [Hoeflea marina]